MSRDVPTFIILNKIDEDTYQEGSHGAKWTRGRTYSDTYRTKIFDIEVDTLHGFTLYQDSQISRVTCMATFPSSESIIGVYSDYDENIHDWHLLETRKVEIVKLGYSDRPGCNLTIQSMPEGKEGSPSITVYPYLSDNNEGVNDIRVVAKFPQALVDKLIMAINVDPSDVVIILKTPLKHFNSDKGTLIDFMPPDSHRYENTHISFWTGYENPYKRYRRYEVRSRREKISIEVRKLFSSAEENIYLLFWISLVVFAVLGFFFEPTE